MANQKGEAVAGSVQEGWLGLGHLGLLLGQKGSGWQVRE